MSIATSARDAHLALALSATPVVKGRRAARTAPGRASGRRRGVRGVLADVTASAESVRRGLRARHAGVRRLARIPRSSRAASGCAARPMHDFSAVHGPLPRRAAGARWAVELGCEGLTLGLGGAVVAAGAGHPGLPGHLRRLAEEAGPRRHLPRPLRQPRSAAAASCTTTACRSTQMPPYLIQAVLATEDRRFYDHFGIDIIGTLRALTVNARAVRRRAGRLLDHPAARQEPVPVERAHHRAQDQRGLPGALARVPPDQARDPAALPRPRLHGRRHLRHPGGVASSTSASRSAT